MKSLARVLADPQHKLFGLWQTVVTVFIFASCITLALETVWQAALRQAGLRDFQWHIQQDGEVRLQALLYPVF